jgi:cytochrome c
MAAILLISNSAKSLPSGGAARGATVYRGCMACHSLDKNVVGPKHEGVFGAKAGAVPDYRYSDALKNSGIVWNEDMLDKWLANPQTLVPGTTMFYLVKNAQDRADVIAFLKEKSGKMILQALSHPFQRFEHLSVTSVNKIARKRLS